MHKRRPPANATRPERLRDRLLDFGTHRIFAALFVAINVMEHALVLDLIGKGIAMVLEAPQQMASSVLLASAALASSVTDNIPLSAVLAKILNSMQTESTSPYWWCVIFGSNLGGNLTPIGSASTGKIRIHSHLPGDHDVDVLHEGGAHTVRLLPRQHPLESCAAQGVRQAV